MSWESYAKMAVPEALEGWTPGTREGFGLVHEPVGAMKEG